MAATREIKAVVAFEVLVSELTEVFQGNAGTLRQVVQDLPPQFESPVPVLITLVGQAEGVDHRAGHGFQQYRTGAPLILQRRHTAALVPEPVEHLHSAEGHGDHVGVELVQAGVAFGENTGLRAAGARPFCEQNSSRSSRKSSKSMFAASCHSAGISVACGTQKSPKLLGDRNKEKSRAATVSSGSEASKSASSALVDDREERIRRLSPSSRARVTQVALSALAPLKSTPTIIGLEYSKLWLEAVYGLHDAPGEIPRDTGG